MNIIVFDTETTSLEKPFCYNVGYKIVNTEKFETLLQREYVIEQCWHNLALFSSAYYADKRPLYVSAMKGKRATLEKWGYAMQQMARDIKAYEVAFAYAYNCAFDEKVFNFNCEWYKTQNPLDTLQVFDIRGCVMEKVAFTDEFKEFCETYELFTESGNYSTTAETLYKYIANNPDFVESHTALDDSRIETDILQHCIKLGCEFGIKYPTPKSVERIVDKTLIVVDKINKTETEYHYQKRTNRGNKIFLS